MSKSEIKKTLCETCQKEISRTNLSKHMQSAKHLKLVNEKKTPKQEVEEVKVKAKKIVKVEEKEKEPDFLKIIKGTYIESYEPIIKVQECKNPDDLIILKCTVCSDACKKNIYVTNKLVNKHEKKHCAILDYVDWNDDDEAFIFMCKHCGKDFSENGVIEHLNTLYF